MPVQAAGFKEAYISSYTTNSSYPRAYAIPANWSTSATEYMYDPNKLVTIDANLSVPSFALLYDILGNLDKYVVNWPQYALVHPDLWFSPIAVVEEEIYSPAWDGNRVVQSGGAIHGTGIYRSMEMSSTSSFFMSGQAVFGNCAFSAVATAKSTGLFNITTASIAMAMSCMGAHGSSRYLSLTYRYSGGSHTINSIPLL